MTTSISIDSVYFVDFWLKKFSQTERDCVWSWIICIHIICGIIKQHVYKASVPYIRVVSFFCTLLLQRFWMFWDEIEENIKARSHLELNRGHPVLCGQCSATELQQPDNLYTHNLWYYKAACVQGICSLYKGGIIFLHIITTKILDVLRWNRGKYKGQKSPGIEPRTPCLMWPVFCHWATTTGQPPALYICDIWIAQVVILYVYCTGGTDMLSHTPQYVPSESCPENSLHQERTHAKLWKWKGQQLPGIKPEHLACIASALPLSYDNWTTTSPHNPLYVAAQTRCPRFNSWCLLAFSLSSILHKAKKTSKMDVDGQPRLGYFKAAQVGCLRVHCLLECFQIHNPDVTKYWNQNRIGSLPDYSSTWRKVVWVQDYISTRSTQHTHWEVSWFTGQDISFSFSGALKLNSNH